MLTALVLVIGVLFGMEVRESTRTTFCEELLFDTMEELKGDNWEFLGLAGMPGGFQAGYYDQPHRAVRTDFYTTQTPPPALRAVIQETGKCTMSNGVEVTRWTKIDEIRLEVDKPMAPL